MDTNPLPALLEQVIGTPGKLNQVIANHTKFTALCLHLTVYLNL